MAIKLIILLILAHQFHAVSSIILKGTPTSTYPFGSKVKLTCVGEGGGLIWTSSSGDILFNQDFRYAKDEKYDNLDVEISGNQSSMIITDASFDNEGEYSCSDAVGKETILVKLEVAPRLIISFGGPKDPGPLLPSSSSPSISITCLAEEAKPEVSIRFKVGESDWLSPTNNEITPRGVLFDTNATLNYQFIDDPNGNVVTCETSGQSSIKPIAETQTLMTPNCNLEMNSIEATCNCTSNPPVYKYILSIDGKMEVGKTLNVEKLGDANISCFGVNYIGVGTSSSIVLESISDSSFPFYVIIIVLVVLVAVIALVVVHRWKKKCKSQAIKFISPNGETPNDANDTELSESKLSEQIQLLNEDSNQKSEENTKNPAEKGDGSPCAEHTVTVYAVTGKQNQSQAPPEQNAVQSAKRDSNELGSKGGSKEGSNGAKNKEENEKNKQQDELKMLKGKFGERSKQYEEAVKRSLQHNQPVNSKEEGSEDSTTFLEAPQK